MSECEMPSVYKTSEPVARKVYRCCECRTNINVGEKHFHGSGLWDGKFSSYRQHLACMEACMLIRDNWNDGECIGFGELMDYAQEFREDIACAAVNDEPDAKRFRHLLAVIKWRHWRNL